MGFFSSSRNVPMISYWRDVFWLAQNEISNQIDAINRAHEQAHGFIENRVEALEVVVDNANISFEKIASHDARLVERYNEMNGEIQDELRAIDSIQSNLQQYGSTMDEAKIARLHSQMQQHAENIESIQKDQGRLEECQSRLYQKRNEIQRYANEAIDYHDKFIKAWDRLDRSCGRISEALSKCSACLNRARSCGEAAGDALAKAAALPGEDATWYGETVTVSNIRALGEAASALREQAGVVKQEAQAVLDEYREANSYLHDPTLDSVAPEVQKLHAQYCSIARVMEYRAKALEVAADMLRQYVQVPKGLS